MTSAKTLFLNMVTFIGTGVKISAYLLGGHKQPTAGKMWLLQDLPFSVFLPSEAHCSSSFQKFFFPPQYMEECKFHTCLFFRSLLLITLPEIPPWKSLEFLFWIGDQKYEDLLVYSNQYVQASWPIWPRYFMLSIPNQFIARQLCLLNLSRSWKIATSLQCLAGTEYIVNFLVIQQFTL